MGTKHSRPRRHFTRLLRTPTRFEKAYINLYNDRITLADFPQAAGIADPAEAWTRLVEYRRQGGNGLIPDPRDTFNRWRGDKT